MPQNSTNRLIKRAFTDLDELYRCYMPFISGGGLFLSMETGFHLGESVYLLIELPREAQPVGVEGKVVWVTPVGAGNRFRAQGSNQGIGVQFMGESAKGAQLKLEKLLTGKLPGVGPTHTL
jgi:type IV pilus assembly protein PilZ